MAPQREWFERNYYGDLGVSEDATPKEITRAYRKLARENHPDTHPGDAAAEERFKMVSAAYDVIGDPEKRKEYDEVRRLGPMGGPGGGAGGFGGPGGAHFTTDDLGDLFGGLFTRGSSARGARASRARRGADLETELHLAFAEAARGVTTTVNLTSGAVCSSCGGNGARPGTQPRTCPRCGGRGTTDDNQGMFSFSQPCPECGGRGALIDDPCPTCHGSGTERRNRALKVRVPAGIEDGGRIRLKGKGEPGHNGGPNGDLYLVVHVAPHEVFRQDGRNLRINAPVTFAEAALGGEVIVPTLDGGPVTLRLPPGTPAGRTLRVRGHGVQADKGTGDLLVTIEVAVPAQLNDEQRAALEAFAAATTESPRAALDAHLTTTAEP